MKKISQLVKLVLVVAYILLMFAFIGCAAKQDVVHSNVVYQAQTQSAQLEIIPQMSTPLAAPSLQQNDSVETVTLICDYVAE